MLMNMLSSRKEDVTKLSELCYERLWILAWEHVLPKTILGGPAQKEAPVHGQPKWQMVLGSL
jgi:hypothetical protein